ncbi:hypothetical protein H5410_041626 [Solanum commersonii]|uniref:Uncharacterized protein n=1 Tax=Solanum commersonii TaxID=4109 RepID=A0A9J5XV97_SOLCO|nr:hypothetical protein H5410_041626 [Solanum commersonii]
MESRSHFAKVQGVDVTFTPTVLNDIVRTVANTKSLVLTVLRASINDIAGTATDTNLSVLTELNIHPSYQAIRHTLYGPRSMVRWTKHNSKRLHYIDIIHERLCLVYALMTNTKLKIGAILKSSMRKTHVHRGRMYAFGGLITCVCRSASVQEEILDYMAPLFLALVDMTKTKGLNNEFRPQLTTAECHRCDVLIMAHIYGLEMLRYMNGIRVSTAKQLREVSHRYPLNAHAKAVLGIKPTLLSPWMMMFPQMKTCYRLAPILTLTPTRRM